MRRQLVAGPPLQLHADDEPEGLSISCSTYAVLACLGAMTGALLGMIIELLFDEGGDTDVGGFCGMLLGAIFGLWYGRAVALRSSENRRRREQLHGLARPMLDLEEGLPDGELRRSLVNSRLVEMLLAQRLQQRLQLQAESEDRPMPADAVSIRILPTHCATAEELASVPEEHRSCTICMEEFTQGDRQKTLPCFHRFHGPCIDRWLQQSGVCPICKTRVDRGSLAGARQ